MQKIRKIETDLEAILEDWTFEGLCRDCRNEVRKGEVKLCLTAKFYVSERHLERQAIEVKHCDLFAPKSLQELLQEAQEGVQVWA